MIPNAPAVTTIVLGRIARWAHHIVKSAMTTRKRQAMTNVDRAAVTLANRQIFRGILKTRTAAQSKSRLKTGRYNMANIPTIIVHFAEGEVENVSIENFKFPKGYKVIVRDYDRGDTPDDNGDLYVDEVIS